MNKDKIINKVLLLYLVDNLEKPVDMKKLQNLVFLCQKKMQENGIRGFTYDWIMEEDEVIDHKPNEEKDDGRR